MRKRRIASIALVFGGLVPPTAASSAATLPGDVAKTPCTAPVLADRCEEWSYLHERSYGERIVVHPDGDLVYTISTGWNPEATSSHYLVSALDGDGAEAWSATFAGPEEGFSEAIDVAISGDGRAVCAAGWIGVGNGFIPSGYAVGVACYGSRTGEVLWEQILPTPEGRWRGVSAIAIATVPFEEEGEVVPREVVFVTGTDEAAPFAGPVNDKNFLTHAFDAGDGSVLWTKLYDGPGGRWDGARMIGVSPDGRRLFVAGVVDVDYWNYGVVAYDTATGDEVWDAQHQFADSGQEGYREDWPMAMAVAPDGGSLAITGSTIGERGSRWGTVSFDAADGSLRWGRIQEGDTGPEEVPDRIDIPPDTPFFSVQLKGRNQRGNGLAFDPGGDRLYVTGSARGFPIGPSYTTIAYDAVSGEDVWSSRYEGPPASVGVAHAIAVAPSGDRIYVTGRSSQAGGRLLGSPHDLPGPMDDVATVAYDADGDQLWVARFDGANDLDMGDAIATQNGRVVVAGRSLVAQDPLLPFTSANLLVLSYDA